MIYPDNKRQCQKGDRGGEIGGSAVMELRKKIDLARGSVMPVLNSRFIMP